MRKRAERQNETRQKIVDATVELHQELGMTRTTVSEVATRAGVERATVYRHFPDERSLIAACTMHYFAQHPLPDPEPWASISDPEVRLRNALTEIYVFHRRTERMISRTAPELPHHPIAQEVVAPMFAHWQRVHEILIAGWMTTTDDAHRIAVVLGHAIAFSTWQSLVRQQGADEAEAVEMMVTLAKCVRSSGTEEKQTSE